MIRKGLDSITLGAGDRIVMRTTAVDILTLRRTKGIDLGIAHSSGPGGTDGEIVEAMISPSHPSIGGRLSEIPFLNRFRVRVLGISRHNHIPGPDLTGARLRAADRLLISGGPGEIRGLRDNPHLIGVNVSQSRAFRPNLAPVAIAALIATIAISAFEVAPIAVAAIVAVGAILLFR